MQKRERLFIFTFLASSACGGRTELDDLSLVTGAGGLSSIGVHYHWGLTFDGWFHEHRCNKLPLDGSSFRRLMPVPWALLLVWYI